MQLAVRETRIQGLTRALDAACYLLTAIAFAAELVTTLIVLVVRKLGHVIAWQSEISTLALGVLIFIGGAVAYSQDYHVSIDFFVDRLKPDTRRSVREAMDAVVVGCGAASAGLSWSLLTSGWTQHSSVLNLPETFFVLPFTVGMLLLAVYAGLRLWPRVRMGGAHVVGPVIVGAAILVIALGTGLWGVLPDSAVLVLTLAVLAGLLVLGMPVGVALVVGPLASIITTHLTDPVDIPTAMYTIAGNYLFEALPFFVFTGFILANSGVSLKLAAFIQLLVGRLKGSFYQVIIVTMFVFSGLSGSKFADMAAIGTPMGEMVERYGYRPSEAAAVLSASAVMGETIPPSIALLLLGSVTTVSIAGLFIGGIVPAVILGVTLMVYVYHRAGRHELGAGMVRFSTGSRLRITAEAIPALFLPIILIGGIVSAVASPTEVSSLAVVYGFLLAVLGYGVKIRSVWESFRVALLTSGWILFLIAGATALSWILTYQQVPQAIAGLAMGLGVRWIFLIVTGAILVLFGSVLEGAAAIIVLAPILLPAASALGIDPVQYGLVLVIAMGLGAHLPPIGVGLFVASSVMKTPVERVFKPMLWYTVVLALGLLAIMFIPDLSLALPRALGIK